LCDQEATIRGKRVHGERVDRRDAEPAAEICDGGCALAQRLGGIAEQGKRRQNCERRLWPGGGGSRPLPYPLRKDYDCQNRRQAEQGGYGWHPQASKQCKHRQAAKERHAGPGKLKGRHPAKHSDRTERTDHSAQRHSPAERTDSHETPRTQAQRHHGDRLCYIPEGRIGLAGGQHPAKGQSAD